MGGGELYAYAGLALGHHRVVETGYEYALLRHCSGEFLTQRGVVQHYGADGGLGGFDVEARSEHLVTEVGDVLLLTVVKLVTLCKQLEGLYTCGADHRRKGIGEEVRTAALTEHVYDFLTACGEAAHCAAEALAKRAGVDVYAAVEVEELCHSPSVFAHYACAVALVYHHQGVVLFCQVADLVHRGDVAVHGEDTVCDDDAETLCLGLLEAFFKLCHISVCVAVTHGLAEAYAVYDGGVVEGV